MNNTTNAEPQRSTSHPKRPIVKCHRCIGTGRYIDRFGGAVKCPRCQGSGILPEDDPNNVRR